MGHQSVRSPLAAGCHRSRALILFLSCAVATVQTLPTSQEGQVFRGRVDLIALDVTVVDTKGLPVKGLKAEDFSVRIDGQRRPVRVAEFLEFGQGPFAVATPIEPTTNRMPDSAGVGRGGRLIIILFDDLSMNPGDGEVLTVAAERMLAILSPDDLIGLTTTSGLGPVVSPTRDREPIHTALRSKVLVGRYDDLSGPFYVTVKEAVGILESERGVASGVGSRECGLVSLSETCRISLESAARRLYALTIHRAAMQVTAFRATIEAMRSAPKPRILIALSRGVAIGAGKNEQEWLEPLSRAAAEAEVQLYALTEVDDGIDMRDSGRPVPPPYDRRSARRGENDYLIAGVQTLAAAAGGETFKVVGQAERFFERILAETSGLYRLGVEVPAVRSDQRFVDVKVSVARPRLTVRANRHALTPGGGSAVLEPIETTLRTRLAQGGMAFGVPVALATAMRRGSTADERQLAVEVEVPASVRGPLTAMFALVNASGTIVQSGRREVTVPPSGEDYRITFGVPLAPGHHRLRLAVADASGNIGSIQRAIPPQLPRLGSVRTSDLLVGWAGTNGVSRFLALDRLPDGASTLRVSLELYPDSAGAASWIRVDLTLLHGNDGTPVVTRNIIPVSNADRLTASALLPVGVLTPGSYTIQATILESEKPVGSLSAVFRKAG